MNFILVVQAIKQNIATMIYRTCATINFEHKFPKFEKIVLHRKEQSFFIHNKRPLYFFLKIVVVYDLNSGLWNMKKNSL